MAMGMRNAHHWGGFAGRGSSTDSGATCVGSRPEPANIRVRLVSGGGLREWEIVGEMGEKIVVPRAENVCSLAGPNSSRAGWRDRHGSTMVRLSGWEMRLSRGVRGSIPIVKPESGPASTETRADPDPRSRDEVPRTVTGFSDCHRPQAMVFTKSSGLSDSAGSRLPASRSVKVRTGPMTERSTSRTGCSESASITSVRMLALASMR